ncbi:hypothetical protein Tco_1099510 [Tanacetum coccineum]
MVFGFSPSDNLVSIHYVAREPTWRTIRVGGEVSSIHVPTFIGEDLYALDDDGTLIGFTELGKEYYSSVFVEARAPTYSPTSRKCRWPLQFETFIALVLLAREHECDTSLVLGRPPALS